MDGDSVGLLGVGENGIVALMVVVVLVLNYLWNRRYWKWW